MLTCSRLPRRTHWLWAFLLAVPLFPGGCSRPPELRYTPREEIGKLPAKHQQQIAAQLVAFYGTPSQPTLRIPSGEEIAEGATAVPTKDTLDRLHLKHGSRVYQEQCAGCHGTTGDGQGPAAQYLNPLPRDYRLGRFKFGSTPRGSKPRREDLVRVIRRGAKGTSMPSFRWLPDDDLNAVLDYVIVLSSRGQMELDLYREAEAELEEEDDLDPEVAGRMAKKIATSWSDAAQKIVMPLTTEPPFTTESIAIGAKAYIDLNCFKCHGKDGRGNKAFNVGKDDWGKTAFAADLSSGMLHGGRRPVDIYRRIHAGINATPMPSFFPDAEGKETEIQRTEKIWHVAHFIRSITEGRPLPMDVIDEAMKEFEKRQAAAAVPSATPAQPEPQPEPVPEKKPDADAKPDEKKPEDKKPDADPQPAAKDNPPDTESKP